MNIKYGILAYDEPKENGTSIEVPKKLSNYKTHNDYDLKADAMVILENVLDELKGKLKFRFYMESEKGFKSVYQVNLNSETRNFFEEEIYDDLVLSHNVKLLKK